MMADATTARNPKTKSPAKAVIQSVALGHKRPSTLALRFSPTAWAKLLYLRDLGDTEVGGFGISASGDLLLVDDVRLVKQTCTSFSVKFDDTAVADFFDEQVDLGRQPQQVGRIWIHTHPGSSAVPSGTDEETFARCFGRSDWALMFILAQEGETYARLRFNVGPGGSLEIPVRVDFTKPFPAADHETWGREYVDNVTAPVPQPDSGIKRGLFWGEHDPEYLDAWQEYAGFEEEHLFGGPDDFH